MVLQQIILFGAFIFALGACVGSFLNVVIWRLPYRGREVIYGEKRGPLTLSWPPSHCPVCDAGIRWYQNIPVVSWMVLRAKCANCRTQIPVRYPLVELGTACLFLGFFLASFVAHWQPGFTDLRDWHQAAAFGVELVFIAALLAASAIDADLYIIPLSIPWFLAALGIIAALALDSPAMPRLSPSAWSLAKPILGATAGVVLANILMAFQWMPRSFSGDWIEQERADALAKTGSKDEQLEQEQPMAPPPKLTKFGPWAAVTGALIVLCAAAWLGMSAKAAAMITVCSGILIFLIGVLPRDAGQIDMTDEVMAEVTSSFVRREVLKEGLFLAVVVVCGLLACLLPFEVPQFPWLGRLLWSLLGLLAGGGMVWLIRFGGTVALNKEAMGMGDVHLMAGVGAVIGGPLAMLAILLGACLGAVFGILLKLMRSTHVLPFGPWLSVASILAVLVGNPLIAWYAQFLA